MADGGPPAGDVLERLRRLGRALDAAGCWMRLPPPALARARELFAVRLRVAGWCAGEWHEGSEELWEGACCRSGTGVDSFGGDSGPCSLCIHLWSSHDYNTCVDEEVRARLYHCRFFETV